MAVSVVKWPYGYILDSPITIDSVFDNGTGLAVIQTSSVHGLSSGDIVYLKTTVSNYNGFFYVFVGNTVQFNIYELEDAAEFVGFVKDADGTMQKGTGHTWNCVHLPIAYTLKNTLWPSNSADTAVTISSVTDSNGYCAFSLSGDIKTTGTASALEYVKITNATDDDLNGVWQIISYTNDTTFTLDILYSSANDTALTGASIQYYYNSYHIKVQVWGGLNNGHRYYAQDPYELLATLDLVPDENNEVKFSIHEELKNNIEIKNNLLLATLPNNLDAWTGFFIKYAEVYDDSNGTTLDTIAVSYISDLPNFEGKAVNAILPFKNVYSGALSEYISEDANQKFLTDFETPVLFDGKYFDLSLLWEGDVSLFFKLEYYLNGVLQSTVNDSSFDCFYTGVYRISIASNCLYDRVDVTGIQSGTSTVKTETKTITIDCNCSRTKAETYYLSWMNPKGGFDYWLFTGYSDELIDIVDTGETEENIFPEWPQSGGEFADTRTKQTYRTSRPQRLIRSQHVSKERLSAIEKIKTSPLVQIVNSIYDRRTVLVDTDSFVSLKEENNLHDISFTITYTDDVPSQKV